MKSKLFFMPPALPHIPKELMAWLREEYKPRCYDGTGGLEAHLVFAGKVELVAWLHEEYLKQTDAERAVNALGQTVMQFDAQPDSSFASDDDEMAHITIQRDLLG